MRSKGQLGNGYPCPACSVNDTLNQLLLKHLFCNYHSFNFNRMSTQYKFNDQDMLYFISPHVRSLRSAVRRLLSSD